MLLGLMSYGEVTVAPRWLRPAILMTPINHAAQGQTSRTGFCGNLAKSQATQLNIATQNETCRTNAGPSNSGTQWAETSLPP